MNNRIRKIVALALLLCFVNVGLFLQPEDMPHTYSAIAECIEHVPGPYVVVESPTCTISGWEERHCTVCDEELDGRLVAPLGHTPGAYITTLTPTCTATGSEEQHCTVCHVLTDTQAIPALGHTAGDWQIVTAPTCTTVGSKEQYCTVCHVLTDTQSIPAPGHTPGDWQTVTAPSCTGEGEEEKHCTVCDEVLDGQIIAPLGHTPGTYIITLAPTCTTVGSKEQYCTVCHVLTDTQSIPAPGHTPGDWQTVTAPTCIEAGSKAQYCTDCNALLDKQTIPAQGHTAGDWRTVTAPTCTTAGSQEQICTVCNALLDKLAIPALGHTAGDWVTFPHQDPCRYPSVKQVRCTQCSFLLRSIDITDDLGHRPGKWEVEKRQTINTPGKMILRCTRCPVILQTSVLPAQSNPVMDRRTSIPGKPTTDIAPMLAEIYSAIATISLVVQEYSFPLVTQDGIVVGNVTVRMDDRGSVAVYYELIAKGAIIKAGSFAFLPQDGELSDLAPEDIHETAIDPAATLIYTAPLSDIPQQNGIALMVLNFLLDYDLFAEGVTEYMP